MLTSFRQCLLMLMLILSLSRAAAAKEIAIPDENGQPQRLYAGSYALLIGVSDYTNGWPDLPQVEDDLKAVQAVLQEHGFQVEVKRNPRDYAELDQIFRAFIYDEKKGQAAENRLFIYFAGHGATLTLAKDRDMGYIVPANAPLPRKDRAGFLATAMNMETIAAYARTGIAAKHALFVFDSCFAGSVFDATRAPPEAITYKARDPVRQFITSGSKDEPVPATSFFRPRLVAALRGEGDFDGDGYVTGAELGYVLNQQVIVDSRNVYHPQYGKILDPNLNKGDFVFELPNRPTPRPSAAPKPPDVTFSLDDLDAKAKWQEYQAKLEAGFAQVQRYEQRDISARLKAEAYQQFVRAFGQDNPDSANDDKLRQQAQQRLEYWERQPTPKPTEPPEPTPTPSQEGNTWTDPVTGMEFVWVPKGCFNMGSPDSEKDRYDSEGPVHKVCLDGFWMGKYEVTQAQWQKIMGSNPSSFKGANRPVESISWDEAQEFIKKLNAKTGKNPPLPLPGGEYRLPSEAEWEYACRAGTTTPFSFGETISTDQANYDGNYTYGNGKKGVYRKQTTDVGSFPANAWGLYDMHGNVWEWCADTWHNNYSGAPTDGSIWGSLGDKKANRLLRGGSWGNHPSNVRSAFRYYVTPALHVSYLGLRLVVVGARTP